MYMYYRGDELQVRLNKLLAENESITSQKDEQVKTYQRRYSCKQCLNVLSTVYSTTQMQRCTRLTCRLRAIEKNR